MNITKMICLVLLVTCGISTVSMGLENQQTDEHLKQVHQYITEQLNTKKFYHYEDPVAIPDPLLQQYMPDILLYTTKGAPKSKMRGLPGSDYKLLSFSTQQKKVLILNNWSELTPFIENVKTKEQAHEVALLMSRFLRICDCLTPYNAAVALEDLKVEKAKNGFTISGKIGQYAVQMTIDDNGKMTQINPPSVFGHGHR